MEAVLSLPINAIALDNEEMEYVNGGANIQFTITKSVLNAAVGVGATAAATAALAAAGITGGVAAAIVPGLAGIIGACVANKFFPSSVTFNYPCNGSVYILLFAISGFDGKITLGM